MHKYESIQWVCSRKSTHRERGKKTQFAAFCKNNTVLVWGAAENYICRMKGKKTAELRMWGHRCVKSDLIKAAKRLWQRTAPVHLIKSTSARERWEKESKANRGAAARSLSFSLDANQRLDLRAGRTWGTWLCLVDPSNLLLIIPSLTLHPLDPSNPFQLICVAGKTHKHSPLKYTSTSAGNNHIMATELLHTPYYPISLATPI